MIINETEMLPDTEIVMGEAIKATKNVQMYKKKYDAWLSNIDKRIWINEKEINIITVRYIIKEKVQNYFFFNT